MATHLQMDWLDGLLISVFFGGGIALTIFFPSFAFIGTELSIGSVALAPILRRILIGPPDLPPPKQGAGWRLISILGLFVMFASFITLLGAATAIKDSTEPMPDFRQDILQQDAELKEQLKDLDALLDAVVIPAGASEEEIERLEAEHKEKRAKEKQAEQAKTQKRIEKKERDFIQNQQERLEEGIWALATGFAMCLFASVLIRLRYPFKSTSDAT